MRLFNLPIVFITIITFFISISSCEFSVSTAAIENVKMCKSVSGEDCDENIQLFSPEDGYIYVSCNLVNAPSNTIVKFIWKYVDRAEPIIIDEVSVNSEDRGSNIKLSSNLSRPYKGWPPGKYQVEIIIEDSQRDSYIQKFEVK